MSTPSTAPGSSPQKPFQTKLVLLGEAAVGKSSVVLRFVSDDFQENKEPTIGAAFLTVRLLSSCCSRVGDLGVRGDRKAGKFPPTVCVALHMAYMLMLCIVGSWVGFLGRLA